MSSQNTTHRDQPLQAEVDRLGEYAVKGELYIISLTFTLLALSSQYALTGEQVSVFILRLQASGWLFLAISGIAGIVLLRGVSKRHSLSAVALKYKAKAKKDAVNELAMQSWIKLVEDEQRSVENLAYEFLWPAQQYFLIAGVLSLVIARTLASPAIFA